VTLLALGKEKKNIPKREGRVILIMPRRGKKGGLKEGEETPGKKGMRDLWALWLQDRREARLDCVFYTPDGRGRVPGEGTDF